MLKIDVQDEQILRWPEGWPRTRVGGWKHSRSEWRKKPLIEHRKALVAELEHMEVVSATITRSSNERDPGVAVWFSMARHDVESWQDALAIDNPLPTLDEIDSAFKAKARENHPDRGGDPAIYLKLVEARNAAKAWVLGTHDKRHEFVIALDQFDTVGANMAGLRLAFSNMRSLRRLGMPSILERTMKGFAAALPMQTGTGGAA